MLKVKDKKVDLVDFKPGTLIYDSLANKDPKQCVILIVEGYGEKEGCFSGIYLNSVRYSDGFSKNYRGWCLFQGSVEIEN